MPTTLLRRKLVALTPTALIGMAICGLFIFFAFKSVENHGWGWLALLFAALAAVLLLRTYQVVRQILRWEPEELEANKSAGRGVARVVLLAFLAIAVLPYALSALLGTTREDSVMIVTPILAVALIIWILLRSRRFQKEAREKIRERKAREAQERGP